MLLADDVGVEELVNFRRGREIAEVNVTGLGKFFFDDLITEIDALVTDVNTWTGDELLDLLLRLATEGAL